MRTALITENNAVDGQVILHLARLCGRNVQLWDPTRQFPGGWRQVVRSVSTYLGLAAGDGVSRAIVMIDNDGTAHRRPPHEAMHQPLLDGAQLDEGCATCVILNELPQAWKTSAFATCLVVPVQTLETWLLAASGFGFSNPVPENNYHRDFLKRAFYRDVWSRGQAARVAHACAVLTTATLTVLRARPSFVEFERQLANWPVI